MDRASPTPPPSSIRARFFSPAFFRGNAETRYFTRGKCVRCLPFAMARCKTRACRRMWPSATDLWRRTSRFRRIVTSVRYSGGAKPRRVVFFVDVRLSFASAPHQGDLNKNHAPCLLCVNAPRMTPTWEHNAGSKHETNSMRLRGSTIYALDLNTNKCLLGLV